MPLVRLALIPAFILLAGEPDPPISELLKLHTQDAESYRIYRDEGHQQQLELRATPVFSWTNLTAENTQYGHLFVWTHAGRPEAIGTVFSTRAANPQKRKLIHEFHTLSTERLFPVTPESSAYQWKPERGIALSAVSDAPAVAGSENQRLQQMRTIARSFDAESKSREGKTWEHRLLPRPLFTYSPTSGEVLQGALFALISSAGTDPEVLLMIEARHPGKKDKIWAWHAAALRFSDKDLTVKRNGKTLWSSLEDDNQRAKINKDYTIIETQDKTYSCFQARLVNELPGAAP